MYMQVLHHFTEGTWISMDFGISAMLWNQFPQIPRGLKGLVAWDPLSPAVVLSIPPLRQSWCLSSTAQ